jgi:hypothetical protein
LPWGKPLPKTAGLGGDSVKVSGQDSQGVFAVLEIPSASFSGPASPPFEKYSMKVIKGSTE